MKRIIEENGGLALGLIGFTIFLGVVFLMMQPNNPLSDLFRQFLSLIG